MLDLCSKSGLISATIQSHGYINVDVLNEDMPTLRRLQQANLYRNYIWREVSGIGSTGLREESYDLVITSGGFSSKAMSPNDITEVSLTVLAPHRTVVNCAGSQDPAAGRLHAVEHEERPGRAQHRVRVVRTEPGNVTTPLTCTELSHSVRPCQVRPLQYHQAREVHGQEDQGPGRAVRGEAAGRKVLCSELH